MKGSLFQWLDPLERMIRAPSATPSGATPSPSPRGEGFVEGAAEAAPPSGPGLPAAAAVDAPERWSRWWSGFSRISALLSSSRLDFDEVLRAVLDLAIRATRAERGFIILLDGDGLEVKIARNDREETLAPKDHDFSRTIVRRAIGEKAPLFIPDVSVASVGRASGPAGAARAKDDTDKIDSVAELGLRSALCVPLRLTPPPGEASLGGPIGEERRRFSASAPGQDVLGAIYVDSSVAAFGGPGSGAERGEDDIRFFEALAGQATSALVNARLHYQATTDPLSNLSSRWHFQRVLDETHRRAFVRQVPYSLALVDIDDFKLVNDRFGHLAGDQLIREVADAIRRSVRSVDACFRYGGEEFAVLLVDTDRKGADVAAAKICKAVRSGRVTEHGIRVSVSVGIATAPEMADSTAELVKRADQALYRAKALGKDRAEAWNEGLGAKAKRKDKLAGIVTGDFATDYKNVELLIDTIAAINATSDIGELLTLTVDKVVEATGAERGALMLAEGAGKPGKPRLTTVVARDRRRQNLKLVERFSRTIPERVLETGEPVCVVDTASGDGAAPSSTSTSTSTRATADVVGGGSVADLELRTILCVPLATKDRTIGVIYVDSRARPGDLRESSLPFFEALARQVAFAIENARLKARLAYEGGMVEP